MRPLLTVVLLAAATVWASPAEDLMRQGLQEAREGRTDAALMTLRRAAKADPANANVRTALGLVAAEAKQFDEARQALEEAVRLAPASETALFNLAMVYEKLRLLDKARDAWQQFLNLGPGAETREIAERHLERLR